MSGIFGNVAPVQVPDFGATLARAQSMQSNRLAMIAQQRQMDQQDALRGFFEQNGAGFASSDPAKRMNLLSMLAQQGGQGAQMALPMLNQERERTQFQDIMRGAFQPGGGVAPAAPTQVAPSEGGYVDRLVGAESGGDPNARNPRSSATGAAQFIDSTWLQFAQANPQLFQGMSREQVLAARNDPALSRQAADWYRRENMTNLAGQGLPANNGTAALAHRFGPGDAARLLRSDPNAPIASVVSPQVMQANPDLAGRSVGQVVGRYAQQFGGDATPASGAPQGGQPDARAQWVAGAERAVQALTQAGRMEEAGRLAQIINGMRRGESEPLERVRGPDGRERLVPRSQASGMVSEPAPREQTNPLGANAPAAASQTIRRLNAAVADGSASPDDVALWRDAVEVWQRETRNPDGSIVPGMPLSPETQRARDALAIREGRVQDASATPRPGDPPGPRTETTATGGQRTIQPPQVTPQDRERWAKIEVDSGRVTDAMRGFQEALDAGGGTGINAYLNNPRDPAAVRINASYSNLVTALRGEAFLNTGVLQPAEIHIINQLLLNPQSMRGLLANPDSYRALMGELRGFIDAGLARQRRVVLGQGFAEPQGGQAPGPGGAGTAEPPPPATARPSGVPEGATIRRLNPRTGRIE